MFTLSGAASPFRASVDKIVCPHTNSTFPEGQSPSPPHMLKTSPSVIKGGNHNSHWVAKTLQSFYLTRWNLNPDILFIFRFIPRVQKNTVVKMDRGIHHQKLEHQEFIHMERNTHHIQVCNTSFLIVRYLGMTTRHGVRDPLVR